MSDVREYVAENAFDLKTISEWAGELGVPTDALLIAGEMFGKWWFKSHDTPVCGRDVFEIETFLRSIGLVSALADHECVVRLGEPRRASREADIERIQRLINDNEAALSGRKWKWLIGDILTLILESSAAMRVVRQRGILVADVEEAIRRCPQFAPLVPDGGLSAHRVVFEMKRLHTARLGILWLNQEDECAPYISCLDRRPAEVKVHAREFGAARYAVGEIVWVGLEEVTNGRKSRRKHPALLLSLAGHRNDKWILVSLTSDVEGDPLHRRVPNPALLGLGKAGYVWHESQKVHQSQIESHVGWVTRDLVRVVDAAINLRQSQIDTLNAIADAHHAVAPELMSA
jgi:hypothetical protein